MSEIFDRKIGIIFLFIGIDINNCLIEGDFSTFRNMLNLGKKHFPLLNWENLNRTTVPNGLEI